jgi:ribosome-binding protein aMBF1 (putative translation factor)
VFQKNYSDIIKKLRHKRGWTQAKLAEVIMERYGEDYYETIRRIEKRNGNPTMDKWSLIIGALNDKTLEEVGTFLESLHLEQKEDDE